MPKHRPYIADLPKWMRYREYELAMFHFVRGVKVALPSTTDKRALELFIDVYGLDEDSFPLDSLCVKFSQMRRDFEEYKKVNVFK